MPVRARSYLHPVLSTYANDIPNGKFECRIAPSVDDADFGMTATLGYEVKLSAPDIRDFIVDGKAQIVLDVYCSQTLYRDAFNITSMSGVITLPPGAVIGRVVATPSIVVAVPTGTFSYRELHREFVEREFELTAGEALAVHPEIEFEVSAMRTSFSNMVRILHSPDVEKNSYTIAPGPEAISVSMGSVAHQWYNTVHSHPQRRPELFTNLLKDAVVAALVYIITAGDDDAPWARSFENYLSSSGIEIPSDATDFDQMNLIALKILGNQGIGVLLHANS
jgi:hypothetical protein